MTSTATQDKEATGCRPQACRDCKMFRRGYESKNACMDYPSAGHQHGLETVVSWLANAGIGNLCAEFERNEQRGKDIFLRGLVEDFAAEMELLHGDFCLNKIETEKEYRNRKQKLIDELLNELA